MFAVFRSTSHLGYICGLFGKILTCFAFIGCKGDAKVTTAWPWLMAEDNSRILYSQCCVSEYNLLTIGA